MQLFKSSRIAGFVLLFVPFLSAAATKEELSRLLALPLESLMQVNIATKTPRNVKDVSAPVFVYTQQDIRRHGWQYLSELLRDVPGVDVQNAQSGVMFSVRGIADNSAHGNKTVIMLDGHNIGFPSTNSPGFLGLQNDISLISIKRVEILLGPGSTLHGANAFGMVVDLISMTPEDLQGQQGSITLGSDGEMIPAVLASKKYGKWTGMLSATYWRKNRSKLAEVRLSDVSGMEIYDNQRFQDNYRKNLAAHGYLDFGDNYRLGFRYSHIDSGHGTMFLSTDVGRQVFNKSLLYFDAQRNITSKLRYQLRSHYLKADAEPKNISQQFVGSSDTQGSADVGAEVIMLDNIWTYSLRNNQTLLTGLFLEHSRQRPVSGSFALLNDELPVPSPRPMENWDNYAIYAQWEWRYENRLNTVAGLRFVDSIKQYDSRVLPHLGINYHVNKTTTFNFNYQSGYRPPSVFEKGSKAPFLEQNPDLESETINSIDATVLYQPVNAHHLRFTFFTSKAENLIRRSDTGKTIEGTTNPIFKDENIAGIEAKGLELDYRYQPTQVFKLRTVASYTDSYDLTAQYDAEPIVPYKLNLSLEWEVKPQVYLVVDNYWRIHPTASKNNRVLHGKDAPNWLLTNISAGVENLGGIKDLSASLVVRNFWNDSFGHVDRRGGSFVVPAYHPQELISSAATVRYRL